MELNNNNYYSRTANHKYISSSQYRAFMDCEAAALAELEGDYEPPVSVAMTQGGYVDAHVEGTLDQFRADHPEMISSRGPTAGQLKADYRFLDDLIARFERDPVFLDYLAGDKQVILTGEIAGVPYKGKIDILHPDRIVDLKTVRDFAPVWDSDIGSRVTFIEAWRYLEQGAIYQELERQKTGKVKPFYIAAVTKEAVPDIALIHIPDDVLKEKLEEIKHKSGQIQALKMHLVEPQRCEKCDYCKATKVLTGAIDYRELI